MVIGIALILAAPVFAETLEGNYNDMLHYLKIGRFDLAKGYAQAILDGNAAPLDLFALADGNPQGYALVVKAKETSTDKALADVCGKVVDIIEQGRFIRRSDPKVILDEIARLSSTSRGQLNATKRLQDAGEYSIMYMIDALGDDARKAEWANISTAMGQMSKEAIRPLAAALQTSNVGVKSEIIKAMGKIGYPQSLPYLKYVAEKDSSAELKALAEDSIKKIDPMALKVPASQLCYQLAEDYYYHAESLAPAADANFANMWFWDAKNNRLDSERVDKRYFSELMAMRTCEQALKADENFSKAIGLWIASFFKAESYGVEMPAYFGTGHADAMTYATTAGPEYLHQALARALKDKDAQVALGVVEALSVTAGESSLLSRVGTAQPLADALTFDSKAVKYSAAIAIAAAGPKQAFPLSKLVVENLADALSQSSEQPSDNTQNFTSAQADNYSLRAAQVMLKIAITRNPVLDLSIAQDALIAATKNKRMEIQMLAGQTLAYLNTPAAQQAIAAMAMAMAEANSKDIRISAFVSLAVSAKNNGCKLDDAAINALYGLVSSKEIDPGLRAAAAAAYGALNLPSQKVKTLILDQAKS
jgi:hypothetical protein